MPKLMIWTRSFDDWPDDVAMIAASGVPALHLPCISTRALPFARPEGTFAVVIFTSVRAIHAAFADDRLAALVRSIPLVMSFGARCTSELERRGVRTYRPPEIHSAQGLVAHFVADIAPSLKAPVKVLAIGPSRPAYDASAAILSLGFEFTYLSVYETLPLLALGEDECRHYRKELDGVVCFASPSAVQGFVETLMNGDHKELGTKLVAVAIGETTALTCRDHFCKVHCAATQELIALVEKAASLLDQR